MPAPSTPNADTVFAWEKSLAQTKSTQKKNRSTSVVWGLLIVALASAGVWRMVHSAPSGKFVKVVSINEDTAAGIRLGFMNVHFFEVPKELASKDMVTDLSAVSGQVTKVYLRAGEPIHDWMLFAKRDVSLALETHERAISLQLADEAQVDHQLLPEDSVDVLATTTSNGKKFTKTICQAARVLLCAPKEQMLAKGKSAHLTNLVTLAVPSTYAERINEAQETAKIRLVLRNRLSKVQETLKGASIEDLLPASALSPTPANTLQKQMSQAAADPRAGLAAQLPAPMPMPPALPISDAKPLSWIVDMFSGGCHTLHEIPLH